MKLTKDQIIAYGIGLILVFSLFLWSALNKKQLLKDHKLSSAEIYDYSYGGRGHVGTITILFDFYIDQSKIGGSCALSSSEINPADVKSFLLNRSFPVLYDPSNPENSAILIRPADFKKFGYSFPDSLRWVLQYLNLK